VSVVVVEKVQRVVVLFVVLLYGVGGAMVGRR
jgi:hypothetical protein